MNEPVVAPEGPLLDDRYRLVRQIGVGGMGEVWEGEDTVLQRRVAIKLVAGRHRDDAAALARFEREARTGARLSHPRLATVYDYGTADDGVYLVMELLDGETLAERLRRGPLPPEEAAEVVAQAADALAVAHEAGVTHRDVKPSNLMLTTDGTKVMDFGVAASAEGEPLTATGLVIGTAAYLAPERLQGGSGGPKADIYALGAVLVEAITGSRLVEGATPAEVAMAHIHRPPPDLTATEGVPAHVAETAARALAKDPQARPDAVALAAALRGGAGAEAPEPTVVIPAATATAVLPTEDPTPTPVPAPAPGPATRPAQAPGWAIAVGLVLVLLLGVGLAYALTGGDDPSDDAGAPAPTGSVAPATTAAPSTEPPLPTIAPTTAPPPPTTVAAAPQPVADRGAMGDAALTYVETLAAGDFETAWSLTSPAFRESQDRGSWEGFWSFYDDVEVVGDPQVDESSGTVVVPMSWDGDEEAYTLTFVPGPEGRWLVDGPVGD